MPTKLPQPPIARPKVSHSEEKLELVLLSFWGWQRAQVSDLFKTLRKVKRPK